MLMKKLFCVFILFLVFPQKVLAYEKACRPQLWRAQSTNIDSVKFETIIADLTYWAEKAFHEKMFVPAHLASAGKIDAADKDLIMTRKGFISADYAAIFALLYTLKPQALYLNKARSILRLWADHNQPTGNPIDETRLQGLIWAYDLIHCYLSRQDNAAIMAWLNVLDEKKRTWKFGSKTDLNNHRIHQLKMHLMIDKVLNQRLAWDKDMASVRKYLRLNLNAATGETIDYRTRSALYYHNYGLQAWLEINLLSHCCEQPITRAFQFLMNRVRVNKISGEFVHSTAAIDRERANGGFLYAKIGGTFDIRKMAATIVAYHTMTGTAIPKDEEKIVRQAKRSPWLSFLKAREELWSSS